MSVPFDRRVVEIVEQHPAVQHVQFVGSRATGTATALSDWDFAVETNDFQAVARDIGSLTAELGPLAQQWDRLSETQCWMVMLPGPAKLDFIFTEPHDQELPWHPEPSNLAAMDCHFWDWVWWLRSKEARGRSELVASELHKLYDHILHPMGVEVLALSLDAAVAGYLVARDRLEQQFAVAVPRALERAVVRGAS